MHILIGDQRVSLTQGANGRLQATFTASDDTQSIRIPSDCIGTLNVTDIQLEQGSQATPFVEPAVHSADISGIFKDLSDLRIDIKDTERGLLNQININQDGLEQLVADTRRGLEARITSTADTYQREMTNLDEELRSLVSTTARTWQVNLSNAKSDLESTIQVEAGNIIQLVEDADSNNFAKTEMLVNGLQSTVQGDLRSQRTQLENLISSSIESATGSKSSIWQTLDSHGSQISGAQGNISRVEQTLSGYSRRITDMEGNYSSIEQTVSGLNTEVNDYYGGVQSRFRQLKDLIDLRVHRDDVEGIIQNSGDAILAGLRGKGGDMIAELNLSSGGARLAGKNIYLDSNVTWTTDFRSRFASVMELRADQITTGTLDAAKIRVSNLDVNSLSGNIANFIMVNLNSAIGGSVRITGDGLQSTAPDNSQTLIQNGVVLARQSSGSTIGYIGHNPDTPSPFYTISTTLGSNFSLRSLTSRGWENIIEIYPESSDMWLRADRTRVTGRLRAKSIIMEGDVGMAGYNIQNISNVSFQYGSWIYDDYRNSGLRVVGGSDIRWYTGGVMSGSDMGMRMSNSHVLMHRTLSMEGNSITNQSDARLKRNIMPSFKDSLGRFNKAKFKWFEYLSDHDLAEGLHHGLIAQEVLEYAPEWLIEDEQGYYSLNQSAMQMDAFKAIQQLSHKVKKLEEQLYGRTI